MTDQTWLSPAQVATRMGVSVDTIRRRIKAKELAAAQIGPRTYRISEAALAAYIDGSQS